MKIFFHVYTVNNYMEMVEEILSPIYHLKNDIVICKAGNLPLEFQGVQVINHYSNNFEFDTLNLLKQYCLSNPNEKVCYIHTKGITTPNNDCINDWRKYMSYFVINKYNNCLNLLDQYDTCGVDLVDTPVKHYSGNFWWARADYINKLQNVRDIPTVISERHKCEFWICSGDGKHYSMNNSDINVYERHLHRYLPESYIKD